MMQIEIIDTMVILTTKDLRFEEAFSDYFSFASMLIKIEIYNVKI